MELIQGLDRGIILFVNEYLIFEPINSMMAFISWLGNKGFIWILFGILLIVLGKENRKWGFLLLVSLGITALLGNVLLKPLVARTRPYDALDIAIVIERLKDFSFPSGHTAAAFSAAVILLAMNQKLGIVMVIFAVLMGLSRIYLMVHYPSDVLAGALLGAGVSAAVLYCYKKKRS